MSWILGVDTSSRITSLALLNRVEPARIFVKEVSEDQSHDLQLGRLLQNLLADNEVSLQQISLLAAGQGPGSFTGIRIGLSLMKGLSSALRIPLLAFSSFAAEAKAQDTAQDLIAVFADAKRDQCFFCMFSKQGSELSVLGEHRIIARTAIQKEVSQTLATGTFRNALLIGEPNNVSDLGQQALRPTRIALGLCRLALQQSGPGIVFEPAMLAEISPNYVRKPEFRTVADRASGN